MLRTETDELDTSDDDSYRGYRPVSGCCCPRPTGDDSDDSEDFGLFSCVDVCVWVHVCLCSVCVSVCVCVCVSISVCLCVCVCVSVVGSLCVFVCWC